MSSMRKNNIGYFYVILSAILFSLAGILMKKITWSSITINGLRNLFAFIIMAIYLKKKHHKIVINKVVILCGIITLFMNLTFAMATKLTSAANAIVLQFTEPIFLLLILWMIWKVKPERKAVICSIFVFAGIMCFFLDKITMDGMIGNGLAILSGILYAFVFVFKKIKGSDMESSILLAQGASFLISIPWYGRETDYSLSNFVMIAILGIFQMGIAYVLFVKGLETVSPMAASLASTIEPILNPLWVAIFYGEMISPIAIVGAAVVIVSATVYNVLNARTPEESKDKAAIATAGALRES